MLLKTYVDSHTKLQKIRKQPRNHYDYEAVKMILNILLLSLLIRVTSVSPNSSSAISNRPLTLTAFGEKVRENNKLHFVPSQQNSSIRYDNIFKIPETGASNFTNEVISKRQRSMPKSTPQHLKNSWSVRLVKNKQRTMRTVPRIQTHQTHL